MNDLRSDLERIDGRSYGYYKDLRSRTYRVGSYQMRFDHVQGDPFASPSRLRVDVPDELPSLPRWALAGPDARRAAADYLQRLLIQTLSRARRRSGSGKSGLLEVAFVGQEVLERTIGADGEDAAPTNLVADLLNANHRPVRLHGAMLLGFLRDPRALEAAKELRRALREEEATYLRRLLEALKDVRACELEVRSDGAFTACVHNTAKTAKRGLGLELRALAAAVTHRDPVGPPPEVLEDHKWSLDSELAAGSGVRVTGRLPASLLQRAAVVEIVVDRLDLLN